MKIIKYRDKNAASFLRKLDRRNQPTVEVEQTVREIIAAIRENGDKALLKLIAKYGGPVLMSGELLEKGRPTVDKALKKAIKTAHTNVKKFALRSLRKDWSMRNAQGALVGESFMPFQRVGIYIPGGTAPLVSTAIMTVTLAKVAGVPEIVVATPTDVSEKINKTLLYALNFAGATEIYKVGGAQAIAALAYGTKTIKPVQKIFGPGNAYVVEAKRQVFGVVSVDLLPGPSEILVIADDTANAAYIASDLLAQAEHGKGSQIILITTSEKVLNSVSARIKAKAVRLRRKKYIMEVLKKSCTFVLVASLKDAIAIANSYAPEHASVMTRNPQSIADKLRNCGGIFIGRYSPVSAGDFLAGPSHTLPTGGSGKSFSGLTVDMFQRRTSIIKFDKKSLEKSIETIEAFSAVEGLDAHGESTTSR